MVQDGLDRDYCSYTRFILTEVAESLQKIREIRKTHHDPCSILLVKAGHKVSSRSVQEDSRELQGQQWATRRSLIEASNVIGGKCCDSDDKESACNAEDMSLVPG